MQAYAIARIDRIVTTEKRYLLSPDEQSEWDATCAAFEAMSPEQRKPWIKKVVSTYPTMDRVPDPDCHNGINREPTHR